MKTIKLMKSLLLAVAVTAGVNQLQAQNYYTRGHGDVRVGYSGGALTLKAQLDWNAIVNGSNAGTFPTPVQFAPTNLIIVVTNDTVPRPAGSEWDFLGNEEGDPCWYIPQTQDTNRVWFGFSAEDLTPGDWNGDLQITLVDVQESGFGYVSLYQTDAFGSPNVLFDTYDGIGTDDVFSYAVGLHAHYNWVFTDSGTYEVTIKVSGTHKTDGYKEVTDTFIFEVQP